MAEDREDRIRERAYHLWVAAGSPAGQDEQFWANAEREIGPGEDGDGDDHAVDRVVADTFPASDPPANSGLTGPGVTASAPRAGR